MAGVADLFRNFLGGTQQANATPGNPAANPNPASVNGNPTIPNGNNTVTPQQNDPAALGGNQTKVDTATTQATPLDKFKDIWQTPDNTPNPDAPITFTVDPKKIADASKLMDFRQVVTPDVLGKVAAGGEEGVKAMMEAMNNMAQSVFAKSAETTAAIVQKAVSETQTRFDARLPDLIKRGSAGVDLRAENPMFNHPAVAPVIKDLERQMAIKFPNASATELNQQAKDYFQALATGFTPPASQAANTPKEQDWGGYFDVK